MKQRDIINNNNIKQHDTTTTTTLNNVKATGYNNMERMPGYLLNQKDVKGHNNPPNPQN
jgi:hypothetical protein